MEDVVITEEMVKKQVREIKNWTAPGKDEVHGFWIKHLTSLHTRIAQQLSRLLETTTIEEWLSRGKTILLMKTRRLELSQATIDQWHACAQHSS